MGQLIQTVRTYVGLGMRLGRALELAGVPRSSYYYRPTGTPKGKASSTHTRNVDGTVITNAQLVERIEALLAEEFIDYGYKRVAHALKRAGWIVNVKKVYRLMKQHKLLYPPRKATRRDKAYVAHTRPRALYPFHVIEVDIKYVWIEGLRRHAYLVTFLCVLSRFAIVWELGRTMNSSQVCALVDQVLAHPLVMAVGRDGALSFSIRTDNGPQFIAKKLARALTRLGLYHEFIHPGTPQQNGHIEGFHSTVERRVCQDYELAGFGQANEVFERFFQTYNYKRIMAGINYLTPYECLCKWAYENGVELPKPDPQLLTHTPFFRKLHP